MKEACLESKMDSFHLPRRTEMQPKVLNIFVVVLLVGIIGVSSLTVVQQLNYQSLDSQYQDVLSEYGALETLYEQALGDYETVYGQYQSKVAEYDQLNVTYTLLLATHYALIESLDMTMQALLDTTLELMALNQTYLDLLADFEELNVTYYILTGEYDALNATYQILLEQHSQLNTTYFDLIDSYDVLQGEYDFLSMTYDQLLSEHGLLQADYDQLLLDFNMLQGEYDILLADYTQLQADHDALQSDYNNLWLNYNTLWAAHQALQNDYDALQASYDTLKGQYNQLQADYEALEQDYLNLQMEYDILNISYWVLQSEYNDCQLALTVLQVQYSMLNDSYWALDASYIELQADFDALEVVYNTLTTWIRQQILPVQYMVFAEAVRRYYFEDFYVQNTWAEGNVSGYWTEFARFCRDVILHSQYGCNGDWTYTNVEDLWFSEVSNALANALLYGNDTCLLSYASIITLDWCDTIDWWNGELDPYVYGFLRVVDIIVSQCISNIDYEYDSDITVGQEFYYWDYIKFPVETAFRTKGDCEDQAILCAAYLESCGFETAMAVFHDDNHPTYGEFYHGVLLVHIENTTAFWERYPETPLWQLGYIDPYAGTYSWCWVDTTWDTPFGTEPDWLPAYGGSIAWEYVTLAICDLDGSISYVSGTGLGAYMP